MTEDSVKMDAIVVGGGPAGLAAAFVMAKAGLEVCVIERGEFAGSKNVGGLLYGTVINELIPAFYDKAPIERYCSRREIIYLGKDKYAGIQFGADEWSEEPYNDTFIVYRSAFDKWFAGQVEEAGGTLLESMVADELVYEGEGFDKKAVGVKLRGDEIFYADVIVLADGANALLTEQVRKELQLKPGRKEQEYAVGVKEIIGLPQQTIEDRFNITEKEGVALDFFGTPFSGLVGGGFIYTAKEGLHLGAVSRIQSVVDSEISPNEMMENFKRHPFVSKLIRGGELLEYSAHMIPEGGYDAIGELAGNGVLIVGDAAGLVNMSIYKEGTNHAMASGVMAAEAAIQAKETGDFSKKALSAYEKSLHASPTMKDLKKYKDVPDVMEGTPNLFAMYPDKAVQMMVDFFTVTAETKGSLQKAAIKNFLTGLPKVKFAADVFKARKLM